MTAVMSSPAALDAALTYVANPFRPVRRRTREVMVGGVGIGGANPIRVQSMTTTSTKDVAATTAQAMRLVAAGCEIVRITAPTPADARAIGEVRARLRAQGIAVPLVADIHFSPAAALEAVQHVEKVRVNPGNFADSRKFAVREYTDAEYEAELERIAARFTPLVLACKQRGVAMRIGTNHGSLSDRIMNRFGDSPLGMVESALEFVRICEAHDFHDIVLSMKASNPTIMIAAYRLLVARMNALGMDYPLHLGVTEAGNGDDARIKSATGIGSLLLDGLGDTIRVSLAEEPEEEIPVARRIVALCARPFGGASRHAEVGARPAGEDAPAGQRRAAHGATMASLPWNPFAYARRTTRPVRLGALQVGGGATIAVTGVVPREDRATLPVLNGAPRKAKRPDALVVDLEGDADLDQLRRLAWRGAGASPRPLIARARDPRLLDVALAHAEALCLVLTGQQIVAARHDAAVPALVHALRDRALPLWLTLDLTSTNAADESSATADDSSATAIRPQFSPAPQRGAASANEMQAVSYESSHAAMRPRGSDPALAGVVPATTVHGQVDTMTSDGQAAADAVEALVALARCSAEAGVASLLLSVRAERPATIVQATRALVARLAEHGLDLPLLLEAPAGADTMLAGAAALGSLLCDGLGDAVQAPSVALAFDLLQGAGARLTRTDYVACPSCGRTLFDLQTTTDRIKARTSHLKGVKIAIMGCVVNGPGEMADADFGYMGGSPGHVNLYVGKECIERGVPEGDADDRLIALIKAHGRWVEPGEDAEE